ncbi:hypothetical protein QR680_015315 [Steinernema hermaphroditum]|uniref:MIF4G domain-containing protein n=1 Tax=Steinernema hermaphroditum TaxID=289476 RepID=A0AA39H7J0_9BILA|nr:hypothetical protein QR680_015315 [Steinernema hermaphroditum]
MVSRIVYTRRFIVEAQKTVRTEHISPQFLGELMELGLFPRNNLKKNDSQPSHNKTRQREPRNQRSSNIHFDGNGRVRQNAQRRDQEAARSTTQRPQNMESSKGQRKQTPPKSFFPRNDRQEMPKKEESTKTEEPVVLHRAKNAWKPRGKTFDPVAAKTKEMRGLLNKITPTTFEELAEKFLEAEIFRDAAVLPAVVDVIFDKAVEEPTFCALYSDLCARQVHKEKEASPPSKYFFDSVLSRCQKTFQGDVSLKEKTVELSKEISTEEDSKAKALLQGKLEELQKKERRRVIGNIGLIAQLYRHGLVNLWLVNVCIVTILKTNLEAEGGDEAAIECAIKMITQVGKNWDRQRRAEREKKKLPAGEKTQTEKDLNLSGFVAYLQQQSASFSSRIRFAVVDLVDLQKNAWEPRKSQAGKGPKKIEELREEVQKERQKNELEREKFEKGLQKKKGARVPKRSNRRI